MCDETVDEFLLALKFVLDWFLTSKMIKKLDEAFCANDVITLMKILLMSHFLVVKWLFLVLTLIRLILMMLILIKIIILYVTVLT